MADTSSAKSDIVNNISNPNFDYKVWFTDFYKCFGARAGLSDFRAFISDIGDNAEVSLKDYIYQNYDKMIETSSLINNVETQVLAFGDQLKDQRRLLAEMSSIPKEFVANDEYMTTRTARLIPQDTVYQNDDDDLAIVFANDSVTDYDSHKDFASLNILHQIRIKILEHSFKVVMELLTSQEYEQLLDVQNHREKACITKKLGQIYEDLCCTAQKVLIDCVHIFSPSFGTRSTLIRIFEKFDHVDKACEFHLESFKIRLIRLLKTFIADRDTAEYIQNFSSIYYKFIQKIIAEFNDFFPDRSSSSHVIVWICGVIQLHVEQMLHVIKMRNRTFYWATAAYLVCKKNMDDKLIPLGFNMGFLLIQCFYKHLEEILNSILSNLRKRCKTAFESGKQVKSLPAQRFGELNKLLEINPDNFSKDGCVLVTEPAWNAFTFLIFFSADSQLLSDVRQFKKLVLTFYVNSLTLMYESILQNYEKNSETGSVNFKFLRDVVFVILHKKFPTYKGSSELINIMTKLKAYK